MTRFTHSCMTSLLVQPPPSSAEDGASSAVMTPVSQHAKHSNTSSLPSSTSVVPTPTLVRPPASPGLHSLLSVRAPSVSRPPPPNSWISRLTPSTAQPDSAHTDKGEDDDDKSGAVLNDAGKEALLATLMQLQVVEAEESAGGRERHIQSTSFSPSTRRTIARSVQDLLPEVAADGASGESEPGTASSQQLQPHASLLDAPVPGATAAHKPEPHSSRGESGAPALAAAGIVPGRRIFADYAMDAAVQSPYADVRRGPVHPHETTGITGITTPRSLALAASRSPPRKPKQTTTPVIAQVHLHTTM
jgi:hypothetical protein